jgi:hypothetical protein
MATSRHPDEYRNDQHFYVKASRGHFSNPVAAMLCKDYREEDKLTRVIQLTDINNKKIHFTFTTDRGPKSPFSSPCGMAFDPKDMRKTFHLIVNATKNDAINGMIDLDGKQIPAHLETASTEELHS